MENKNILFRSLPKVDEILQKEKIEDALNYIPRDIVLESIREVIEDIRKNIQSSTITKASIEERIQRIDCELIEKAKMKIQPKLRRLLMELVQ